MLRGQRIQECHHALVNNITDLNSCALLIKKSQEHEFFLLLSHLIMSDNHVLHGPGTRNLLHAASWFDTVRNLNKTTELSIFKVNEEQLQMQDIRTTSQVGTSIPL